MPSDSGPTASPAPGRRTFIRRVAAAASLVCVRADGADVRPSPAAPEQPLTDIADTVYLCLDPAEADLVEALVDHMCPGDDLSPRGVECGLAFFIDRQLAGAFGQGERLYLRGPFRGGLPEDGYQLPLTPAQHFKAGARALDEGCARRHRSVFARLDSSTRESVLLEVAAGQWDDGPFGLGAWFNDLLYPLFVQACFSDPVHGGNRDKVFWRMLGYPGLPAVYGRDVVTYRGRPYPGAHTPRSMQDFA